jgi:hypothetical protein
LGGDKRQAQLGADLLLAGGSDGDAKCGVVGKGDDLVGQLAGISGPISQSVLAVSKEFGTATRESADDGKSGGHGFEGSKGKRFLPFGCEKKGIMGAIHFRHLVGRGVMEDYGQLVRRDMIPELCFVGGFAFPIDVQCSGKSIADVVHGFERGEDALVFGKPPSEEELGNWSGDWGDGPVVAMGVDRTMNDLAMGDGVARLFGDFAEAAAAEVESRKTKVAQGVGWSVPGQSVATAGCGSEKAEDAGRRTVGGAIPPVDPDIGSEALRDPMIRHIKNSGDTETLQSEGKRFGETAEVPDVDEIRLERLNGGEQSGVVFPLEPRE